MLIAFLTPKIDPAIYDDFEGLFFCHAMNYYFKIFQFIYIIDFSDDDDDGPALPTTTSEEFRPFIRRLPEFKFW